ncbi:protein phosphatase 2C domain-containing protein [Streptomyces sp. NPDC000410]|uniref:protein phosphatase 2C domain-containing protein n=1 Tax=Streptomyces sp. NPDC000410 TaxID=3154254 RepID=UPI003332B9E5
MIVAGAVVQGTGHLAAGQGCQDAFKAVDLGDAVVLAVADGAGSRDRSALGAHIAVDTACRVLTANVPDASAGPEDWTAWIATRGAEVVDGYLRAAQAVLSSSSGGTGAADRPARDGGDGERAGGPGVYDATYRPERAHGPGVCDVGALAAGVVGVVVRPPWVAFVALGDCFGAVLTRARGEAAERCHLVLPPPDPGGPPPGFLSSPGARLRMRTFTLWDPELSGVVLATDGCAPLTLDHPSVRGLPDAVGPLPSERFFSGLAATLRRNGGDAEPLRALLSGPDAARTGDDLTVLCGLLERG